MKKKFSNQFMIKGLPEGQAGSFCAVCGEQVVFSTPIPVDTFVKITRCFIRIHTLKGCNDKEFKTGPEGQ